MKFNNRELREINARAESFSFDNTIIHKVIRTYTSKVSLPHHVYAPFILLLGVLAELLSLILLYVYSNFMRKLPDDVIVLLSCLIAFFYINVQCIAWEQSKGKALAVHIIVDIFASVLVYEIESCKFCIIFGFKVTTKSLYFLIFNNALLFLMEWHEFCRGELPFSKENYIGINELLLIYTVFDLLAVFDKNFVRFINGSTALVVFYTAVGVYLIYTLVVCIKKTVNVPSKKRKESIFLSCAFSLAMYAFIEANTYDRFINITYILGSSFTVIYIVLVLGIETLLKEEKLVYTKFLYFSIGTLIMPATPFYQNDYEFWNVYILMMIIATGLTFSQIIIGLSKKLGRKTFKMLEDGDFTTSDLTDVPLSNDGNK